MRVISGIAGGIPLRAEPSNRARPTTDKVKQAIFNMLQWDIENSVCLDLFAGSGAMGIEALSRGAAQVDFVDCDSAAIKIVEANLAKTGLCKCARLYRCDYLSFLRRGHEYDIIFLDPPYGRGMIEESLGKIRLSEKGIVVCEMSDNEIIQAMEPFSIINEKRYGNTKIVLLKRMG